MRRVICHECRKQYDFSVDDFCPRCGAFTQPPRSTRIDASGAVVRTDGLTEAYHRESFVHDELHRENRKRSGTWLEQEDTGNGAAVPKQTVVRPSLPGWDGKPAAGVFGSAPKKKNAGLVFWIILIIFLINFLSIVTSILFY